MKVKCNRVAGLVFCGLLALAACPGAFAQGPPPGGPGGFPPPGGGPPGGGPQGPPPEGHRPPPGRGPRADFLSSEMRFGDRPVKGAPYSAQFVSESTRTLADGTRISRKSDGAVYRSAEGRTRRETTLAAVGPVAVEGEPARMVFINDPVARQHYALDVNRRTVRKLPLPDKPPGQPGPRPGDEENVKTESLGKRTVEGVEAEGTRTTITIPTGRVGNDRPLEVVSERWYSPELQVVVLSSHKDPFVGDTVYRLINITRAEPAASLFEVPADYTVLEGGPRRPRP
ncbi:MAG TPA: hypothetical protein VN282_02890 [Pyrinomonadaceae bacterium]|nr:hypothetical protein [Pyrinomonadaceae bacterium]